MVVGNTSSKLDKDGYRPNVGIVVCNNVGQVLWARRATRDGWQFPQGGVEPDESAEDAVFRELYEEVGLQDHQVRLVGRTRDWLHYDIPKRLVRNCREKSFRGQKQLWFLFHLLGTDADVCLKMCRRPEFDKWQWVEYWSPLDHVVEFKRSVYRRALTELKPLLNGYSRHNFRS